jgi:thymidylate synthase
MNYLEIVKNVLTNGKPKQATRYDPDGSVIPVENGTIGTFCEIFRHDMGQGFPLTTLRKMPWKSIRVELEGFIKGITSKKWYQDRNCGFWTGWSNPKAAQDLLSNMPDRQEVGRLTLKEAQALEDDLGPIYGYQWRHFGEHYGEIPEYEVDQFDCVDFEKVNGIKEGADQLLSIVAKLRNSPYDRRMVCSAWNPNQEHLMALPSCHVLHNIVVYGDKLNLTWFQRSCDLTHGVAANIASYALLLLLYCEESGLKPGELVGVLSDCHLYENTLPSARELVKREEVSLPQVKIKRKEDGSFSIFNWTYDEVELIGYNPQEKIDMGQVTV